MFALAMQARKDAASKRLALRASRLRFGLSAKTLVGRVVPCRFLSCGVVFDNTMDLV